MVVLLTFRIYRILGIQHFEILLLFFFFSNDSDNQETPFSKFLAITLISEKVKQVWLAAPIFIA